MLLSEKKVIVIGGSSGIGEATAKLALEHGAEVAILSRDEENLRAAAERLGTVETCAIDVRDERALAYCMEGLAPFDHLVFSASDHGSAPFVDIAPADGQKMFKVKFWGAFSAVQASAGSLRDGGSITLLSGIAAQMPVPGLSVVAAINGAIEALVRTLAVELKPVRVNAVAPGFIDSGSIDSSGISDEMAQRITTTLPVQRIGKPEDAASAVIFAMTNPYVTGTTIRVDGGRSLV